MHLMVDAGLVSHVGGLESRTSSSSSVETEVLFHAWRGKHNDAL